MPALRHKNERTIKSVIETGPDDAQQRLPKAVQSALIDFQKEPALYAMMGSEVEYWKADAARIRIDPFPDLPLIVIARDAERAIQDGIDEGLPESELRQVEETWHRLVLRQATLTEEAIFTATEADIPSTWTVRISSSQRLPNSTSLKKAVSKRNISRCKAQSTGSI